MISKEDQEMVQVLQETKELLLGVRRDCMEAVNALNLNWAAYTKRPRTRSTGVRRVTTLKGNL